MDLSIDSRDEFLKIKRYFSFELYIEFLSIFLYMCHEISRIDEHFGWDTSSIETGSTEWSSFNDGYFFSELSGSSELCSPTGSDDDKIIVLHSIEIIYG